MWLVILGVGGLMLGCHRAWLIEVSSPIDRLALGRFPELAIFARHSESLKGTGSGLKRSKEAVSCWGVCPRTRVDEIRVMIWKDHVVQTQFWVSHWIITKVSAV